MDHEVFSVKVMHGGYHLGDDVAQLRLRNSFRELLFLEDSLAHVHAVD